MTPQNGRYDIMVGIWLVCLSSDILKKSRQESLYSIAHELAHVYLDHQTADRIEGFAEMEIETDKQLIKWDFKSELRQNHSNLINGEGIIQFDVGIPH